MAGLFVLEKITNFFIYSAFWLGTVWFSEKNPLEHRKLFGEGKDAPVGCFFPRIENKTCG